MKKNILFGILCFLCCLPNLWSQDVPKGAKYWIKGTQISGKETKLTSISSKGLYFNETIKNRKDVKEYEGLILTGKVGDNDSRYFTFARAIPDLQGKHLKFYKKTSDGKWQIDSEVEDGGENFTASKDMVVMLALDCSQSLEEHFSEVQEDAINFIRTLFSKNQKGNICIGIIGFNSMAYAKEHTMGIQPLTSNTLGEMEDFIRKLEKGKNTAIYFSIDTASQMIDAYVKKNYAGADVEKYDGAAVVTFTDGYDNASYNFDKFTTSGNDFDNSYFKYVQQIVATQRIESYVIAIQSTDVDGADKFKGLLQGISTDAGHFTLAKDFKALEDEFEKIANSLTDKWRNLCCYVPPVWDGEVCWVLQEDDKPLSTPVEEKKTEKMEKSTRAQGSADGKFLGVSLGAGFIDYDCTFRLPYGAVDFSFAFPLKSANQYSLGAYVMFSGSKDLNFSVGPLLLIHYQNRPSLMLGAGVDIGCLYNPEGAVNLRVGGVWKKFYMFFNGSLGGYNRELPCCNKDCEPVLKSYFKSMCGMHFGYRF